MAIVTPDAEPLDEAKPEDEKIPVTKEHVDIEVDKLDRTDYDKPEHANLVAQYEAAYADKTTEQEDAEAEAAKREALQYAINSKFAGDAKYRAGDYDAAMSYYKEEQAFLEKTK